MGSRARRLTSRRTQPLCAHLKAVRSPDRRPSTCRRMVGWLCDRFNNQYRVHRCHGKHPPKRTAAKPRTNLIAVQGTISADQSSAIRLIPVWNIQLVRSRAKVPLALNRNCPSAEPKLVDLASSSKAIPRCSHCDFGRWRQCVGKGGAAGRRLARTQGSRGRIHGRVQRAPNREFPFGTLSAVQILKRGMLE